MSMEGTKGVPQVVFAIVLLMIGGILNIIWGIAAIGNSKFFVNGQQYIFSDLKGWGWITLIIGVLEILASLSLINGSAYGQWFAIGVGMVAAIGALLDIPAFPLWSIAVFALSLWVIWGLVHYRGTDDYPAASRSSTG
jgi:hypothetical protein